MSDKIRAKVARILNSREIVINAGAENGITEGMYFDVLDPKGEDIVDPDSGEILGSIDRPKVRVRVSTVQERMAVACTFRKKRVNIGGNSRMSFGNLDEITKALMPPQYVDRYETLKTREKTWEDLDESESFVKIGDPVVQVLERIEEAE